MPLDTDLNVSPYFDDYDENKKFYRILFRPSVAVQARELTQAQTIMQKQIERLGGALAFSDGSVVKGCSPTVIPNFDFVRVVDNFTTNPNVFITDITSDYLLVGQDSGARAVSLVTKSGLISAYPDTNRFYVKYVGEIGKTFSNGEVIAVYDTNQSKLGTLVPSNIINTINVISTNSTVNAIGQGYGLRIEDGIIYHKGFFQLVDDQTIIVKGYDQSVENYVVGFQSTEEIITENDDESLLDNALGYSNENAPGAHRLKLTPTIVARNRSTVVEGESFFSIYEFSNVTKELVFNKTKNVRELIGSVLSTRTYDESGDYVSKPFLIETVGPTTDNASNTDLFAYQVSPGKCYVHGNEVEFIAAQKVDAPRAITTKEVPAQVITANFGNYVYANQVNGVLDYGTYSTVYLYDTPQEKVSKVMSSGFTGNKVGSAKVKQVLHDEGNPGLPTTTYRVYLTDIVMDSGKSFTTDVKAVVANTTYSNGASWNALGPFYADVANSTTTLVLNDSTRSNLVFPFGKKALRRLRSANGTQNRTSFYYRASSNTLVELDGSFSITVPSSYTGGADRIGYSIGTLGDTLEDQFILTLTSATSTVNVGTTINISASSPNVATAGLNTYFANGEYIKIYSNTVATDYLRVVSVNATAMVLNANPSWTNTAANFAKYFPVGYNVPFDGASRTVTVTTDTTFTVNSGVGNTSLTLVTKPNAVVQYRMQRSIATQAKKDIHRDVYIKLNLSTHYANTVGPWSLGLPDILTLKKVYANTSGFSTDSNDDVTQKFNFRSGQKNDYYDHGQLILKPEFAGSLSTTPYITVVVDHFTANLNNGVGFFSVDSYPTTNNTPNTSTIAWGEIPQFITGSTSTEVVTYDLRDCIDFRGYKANTANSATSLATATTNPANTTQFISYSSAYLSEADQNFQADIEYYLGRVDLLTVNKARGLGVVTGLPSEEPKPPQNDTDAMVLATGYVPPFPSLNVRESESYRRMDYTIRTVISSNRVYTMKDIGKLDERIKRLEYYTTLNQLEQKAQNIQVSDASGLNRFKNGIFADPMTSHVFADSTNSGYLWSIDSRQGYGYGRPTYISENVDLAYNDTLSSGVQLTGRMLTRPYSHELLVFQPYATKYRNNNQDIWSWNGTMNLYPNYDMNRDETRLPNIDGQIDMITPFMDFANAVENTIDLVANGGRGLYNQYVAGSGAGPVTIFGTNYGNWYVYDSYQTGNPFAGQYTYTFYRRNILTQTMTPTPQTIDLGRFIEDISVQPYIKERQISFVANGLRPSSRFYAYFDGEPVSQYCAPGVLDTTFGSTLSDAYQKCATTGRPDKFLTRSGPLGTPLVSDQYGNLLGVFQVPAGKFRIGDRTLTILDSDIFNVDSAISKTAAVFTASNIAINSKNATITTTTPTIRTCVQSQSTYSVSYFRDPIAQSFTATTPTNESGVFATKMDLFFQSKDENSGIRVYICGMNNGVPDNNKVYGFASVNSSSVNVSNNASTATTFTFEQPVFLSSNTEYAFYVEPETVSPDYRMWVSEMGFNDVLTNAQVFSNPYTGELFRSSNSRTWTALPREDIKFNLYVANFTVGTGTAVFENESDEFMTIKSFALANSSINVRLGDEVYVINSASNTAIVDTSIHGSVQTFDNLYNRLKLDSSTGNFTNNHAIGFFRFVTTGNTAEATVNTATLIATANVVTIDDVKYHAIVPRFATALPLGTTVTCDFVGTSNTYVTESTYNDLELDNEREMLDNERIVYSRSNEIINTSGNKTLKMRVKLNCANKYMSPAIDLNRKSALVIFNVLNNDTTDEHLDTGKAIARYISQPITLADGQDAEDIKVYLSAYRPYLTDIEVYVRFLDASDPEQFSNKSWTKLVNESPNLRSSPIDRFDFKEFVYSMPTSLDYTRYSRSASANASVGYTAFSNASNFGVIQYTSSSGAVYRQFKTFAIKIVLTSSDGVFCPKLDDLRGIALQV